MINSMSGRKRQETKGRLPMNRKTKRLLFYIGLLAIPMIQFAIFTIGTYINSFLLAFQEYNYNDTGTAYIIKDVGWAHFKTAWQILTSSGDLLKTSLIDYVFGLTINLTFSLVFSFYMAKKYWFARFFRVMLYLPHVVSSIVFVLLFNYIVTDVYMVLYERITGEVTLGLLDQNADMQFIVILLYNFWFGFGTSCMLYTNSMSGVDRSLIEAAQLDGANVLNEFIHIYFPCIYPTFVTLITVGVSGIFTTQMNLYTFFGDSGKEKFSTLGFWFFRQVKSAGFIKAANTYTYCEMSAFGLLQSAIVAPISLIVRRCLRKYGPSTD